MAILQACKVCAAGSGQHQGQGATGSKGPGVRKGARFFDQGEGDVGRACTVCDGVPDLPARPHQSAAVGAEQLNPDVLLARGYGVRVKRRRYRLPFDGNERVDTGPDTIVPQTKIFLERRIEDTRTHRRRVYAAKINIDGQVVVDDAG